MPWQILKPRGQSSVTKANDNLRGAAFHEAGHVVVAREFGLSVGEIAIDIDGGGHRTGGTISARLITCQSPTKSRCVLPGSSRSRCLLGRRTDLPVQAITQGFLSSSKG